MQDLSKIAVPTSILKTIELFHLALIVFKAHKDKIVGNDKADKIVKNLFKSTMFKNIKKLSKAKGQTFGTSYFSKLQNKLYTFYEKFF